MTWLTGYSIRISLALLTGGLFSMLPLRANAQNATARVYDVTPFHAETVAPKSYTFGGPGAVNPRLPKTYRFGGPGAVNPRLPKTYRFGGPGAVNPVLPKTYTFGGPNIIDLNGRYVYPNVVPSRRSATPEQNPYFSFQSPQKLYYSPQPIRSTPKTPVQQTMGLNYTKQGSLDHVSMYMEWGAIAVQQNQLPVALSWYEKALQMRPNDPNLIRIVQSIRARMSK